jgi:hypothetical protein
MPTEEPSEQEIGEREEREHLDRAWGSNDKVQFDNVISHNNIVARQAEIALSNAVMFQAQMNQEYLRSVHQEREHADERTHLAMAQMDAREKQVVEHIDTREKHLAERINAIKDAYLENNRYTLDRLYSVFPEEAVGLRILVKGVEVTREPEAEAT